MAKIKQLFANNAKSTLDAQLLAAATTLNVATGDGSLFPTVPNTADEEFFFVTLIRNGPNGPGDDAIEIVKVERHTAASDTFETITRAQEGTSALQFEIGDEVDHRNTAETMSSLVFTRPAGSTAIGDDAVNIQPDRSTDDEIAQPENSINIGFRAKAEQDDPGDGPGMIVIGSFAHGFSSSSSSNPSPVVIGTSADANERSVAIGSSSFAGSTAGPTGGKRNVAIGTDATVGTTATYNNNVVIGEGAGQTTAGNDGVCIGRSSAFEGDDTVCIGSGLFARGNAVAIGAFQALPPGGASDYVAIGRSANPFGTGGFCVAIGRSAQADTEGIAIGASSLARERMCHIAAPIYIQDDPGATEGDELINFAGAEVALATKSYDFTLGTPFTGGTSATLDIVVPSGMKFYPNQIEFVTDTQTSITTGPDISVGTPAAPTKILGATVVTAADIGQSGGRETFLAASEIGETTVRITVNTAATATTLTGRIVLRGLFIRNSS